MMVLFHNTECGNKGNTLKSWLLLSLSLFPSDCIGLAYEAVTWWTNDSNPKTRDELINSLSGSNCIGLVYEAVTWWTNDSNPKTRDELINSLSGSNSIGYAYGAVTWWTNDSKNPKTRNRWTNSVQNLYVAHARLNESLPETTRSSRVTLKIRSKWTNRSRPTHHYCFHTLCFLKSAL